MKRLLLLALLVVLLPLSASQARSITLGASDSYTTPTLLDTSQLFSDQPYEVSAIISNCNLYADEIGPYKYSYVDRDYEGVRITEANVPLLEEASYSARPLRFAFPGETFRLLYLKLGFCQIVIDETSGKTAWVDRQKCESIKEYTHRQEPIKQRLVTWIGLRPGSWVPLSRCVWLCVILPLAVLLIAGPIIRSRAKLNEYIRMKRMNSEERRNIIRRNQELDDLTEQLKRREETVVERETEVAAREREADAKQG